MTKEATVDPALAAKYLVFRIGAEHYAVRVLAIREIVRPLPITKVPNKPRYMRGVLNLRGKVTPVIDLGDAFGMGPTPQTEQTVILFVQSTVSRSMIGLVVHEVLEVLEVRPDMLRPRPSFGLVLAQDFVLAMASSGERLLFLIDLDRCLTDLAAQIDHEVAAHERSGASP